MSVWALIPCSKRKAGSPCTAREMYWPSQLFRATWQVAEAAGQQPLILSARYGLVLPDEVIEPYDMHLAEQPEWYREAWAERVLAGLQAVVRPGDGCVSYLGAAYAELVVPALREQGYQVDEPLAGLGLGERLAWLQRHRRSDWECGA